MKICSLCHQEKTLDHFRRDKTRLDGFHPWCKECQRIKRREARNNSEIVREGERRRHEEYNLRKSNKLFEEISPSEKASSNLKKYYQDPEVIQSKRDFAFKNAMNPLSLNNGGHKIKGDDNINYRSKFEALFARFLKENDIPFEYDIPYKLIDGRVKIIDFLLYDRSIFVEVSGYGHEEWRKNFDEKMFVLRKSYENPILIVTYNDKTKDVLRDRFCELQDDLIDTTVCSFSDKKRLLRGINWLKSIYCINHK